ncbi:hypothetical protein Pla110_38400 [Polystyrenella longa]|uniref:3-keto-alpha-glucoside-1,2-lyase/3-keto-2-hydroxy-glucal hydratase domain-containing protein n=1 Tax=Polystyrenella longa TaxID=2528007 RepID=A0A518CS95_9PLAN|nr:DUF1080 domain-containing protein [Polystyrenella longa]QDU82085.1 hypothetical protein Pla110_38400 [Polystyrenella longa]
MHLHASLFPLLVFLIFTTISSPLSAAEYTLSLTEADSLSGWQHQGEAQFTRDQETLTFSNGKSGLSFDYPVHEGAWSFELTTPAAFQGKILARLESGKESHVLELLNSESSIDKAEQQTVAHQFALSAAEINWQRGDENTITHRRQSAAPLQLSIHVEATGDAPVTITNMKVTETGFMSLFSGTDLTGWEGGGQPADVCWKVEEGLLVCTGVKKGPWLRTTEEYGDFNLRIEYWLSADGNSGLYVRVPQDGNHHRDNAEEAEAGFEIQLLDDEAEKYKGKLKDYQYTGSVYDIVGASDLVGNPAGTWNTMELNCKGQHITTILNGKIIVNATPDNYPLLNLRKEKGYLGLQNHSSVVKFRNLRIGPALDY